MNDLGIIDQFLQTFSTYIDSGFGPLAPDVAFLTTALVTIDIVLAGLFWAFGNLDNIVVGFLKKVLYIGFSRGCSISFRYWPTLSLRVSPSLD